VSEPSVPASGCKSGATSLLIKAGPPPAPLYLRLGAVLHVGAESSPRQPWQPLISTDPDVLRCDTQPAAEGSIAGSCTALAVGTATLRTATAPFAGDPYGPMQVTWELAVTVTG
jgi:hypothetical protein